MGNYVNPVSYVEKVGRPLVHGASRADGFSEMRAQLRPGEKLVAVLDRLIWKAAPIIPDADEFKAMYEVYATGNAVSIFFYALTDQQIADASGNFEKSK